jgi:hypothetical protein
MATPLVSCLQAVAIEGKTLRFCYDRLSSLMKTLEITARWGVEVAQPQLLSCA